MIIRYESVTGEVVEIEVDKDTGEAVVGLEKAEFNSNRRETRRHESYNDMNDKWDILIDPTTNIDEKLVQEAQLEKLKIAISRLLPQHKDLITKVYYQGKSLTEIAIEEGVNKSSIHKRLARIQEQLKKYLD